MECIKYLRDQLKVRGTINLGLERAKQAGVITPEADKTTRLAIEKVCETAEMLAAENKQLKQQLAHVQQAKLF